MTIHQLKKPCFILGPSPHDDDTVEPHYATWHEADDVLRELREERGPSPEDLAGLEPVRVKALPGPCWVAECDGPDGPEGVCGDMLGDEDEGPFCVHFETSDEAIDWMPGEGWAKDGPDGALCHVHRPGNSGDAPSSSPSPAELEAAGRPVLPGVLP